MDYAPNLPFLERLLMAAGPSGFEGEATRVFLEEAKTFALTEEDRHGNAYARLNPGGRPKVLLLGHADEIGVIVSHVEEGGFLRLKPLGGWDPQVLVGQRLRFLGKGGPVYGVVGRKAVHVLKEEERKRAVALEDLFADIGARDREEALAHLEVGSVGVLDQPPRWLLGRRLASKALDNRLGAFVVLEALRLLQGRTGAEVVAVATVQEEIGAYGARTAAFREAPDLALVVDVHHDGTTPGMEKARVGEAALGQGVVLDVGPFADREVLKGLRAVAEEAGIPYVLHAHGPSSGTDADEVAKVREGIPTGILSLPLRYMHSPVEVVDLADVERAVRLLALYVARL
ncbi:MAG: M42 family metallopeptidase [Thermus sp.]|uniref:M42 family metallopeptidase n=1 Tax=Thermus sp. TaxID=275 RepID=UPI0025EACCCD|nr:M42 family metallopeptidase [Thermus sp.]MCS7217761.1 M42 family metallopeptidase [Thermus sp.]MCX7849550.1 M42 family metallopeptidase [Thermus sp.]MDW8016579.1 M42 family metallopeptidase [Thermus sp.]MDW8356478.1 M42 family metallopeptidase [Thermus sp.]